MLRWECPKFHVLEYNYSVFAGQRLAECGCKPPTFNNSKIWDIEPLGRRSATGDGLVLAKLGRSTGRGAKEGEAL